MTAPKTISRLLAAWVGGAALLMGQGPAVAADAPTLVVDGGRVAVPAANAEGLRVFKGIPYAAPPVGPLRWKPPEAVAAWSGVRPTESFGADCPQPTSPASPEDRPKSEDCLFVNVWAPADLAKSKLPVYVWFHGGGSRVGSGAQPLFDGTVLAKQGIVVVTVNYRLGIFGFISSTALSAESGYGGSGNYGFMDDIAALTWVQRNIARFGGDPRRVTIGGESSGAVTASVLMSSPLAAGTFAQVIAESGTAFRVAAPGSMGAVNLKGEEARGDAFFAKLGATDLAGARALPTQAILDATRQVDPINFFNLPVVDGHVLADGPWRTFARHKQNDVPLLVGWNSGEGSMQLMFMDKFGPLPDVLKGYYGVAADQVAPLYPGAPDDPHLLIKAAGDYGFGYPNWKWAMAQAQFGKAPVYVYEFDHAPPVPEGYFGPKFDSRLAGAYHGSELAYVFGTLNTEPKWAVGDVDRRISAQMSTYWANFIKTGQPGGPGLPAWPSYDPAHGPQRMHIAAETAAGPDPDFALFTTLKAAHDRIDPPEPGAALP